MAAPTAACAAVLLLARVAGGQVVLRPLIAGEELLDRHRVVEAERAFASAARSGDLRERAEAFRRLAHIAWRFREDHGAARDYLDSAFAMGVDTVATLLECARYELARGGARMSRRCAEGALSGAKSSGTLDEASRAALGAALEPFISARIDGARPQDEKPDSAALRVALERFRPIGLEERGTPDDVHLVLLAALVAHDGPVALEAWRAYYALETGDSLHGMLAAPRRVLTELLPGFGAQAGDGARDRIARALADSRLFVASALVAADGDPPSARAREIVAYARFTRRLERAVDDYYRRTLFGRSRPEELNRLYYRQLRDLWPDLAWPEAPPRYYPAEAMRQIAIRFGALAYFGNTAGYYDLHYGHRVLDEIRVVEQYGHRARVRFVEIDGLVSNGFQSWAWDGRTAHAGWQADSMIIEVRPSFAANPRAMWLLESDPARSLREVQRIQADSASDWVRAGADSVVYLPGVAARIRRDGRRALADSLRASGLAGRALEDAFVAEMARVYRESAVIAHEGRHAIDRLADPEANIEQLEFDAKLSEIAFSSRPKLSLGGILHPEIGEPTPHGRANTRVMIGLITWMRAHAAEIPGFDPSRPVLPQLPLLDDGQFRAAFRSMDPLAR